MAEHSLTEILSRTKNGNPAPKPETDDEDLGDCASRPVVKYVPAFHVKNGAKPTRSFDYHHMGFKEFQPGKFVIEFHEPDHWRLTVEGTNLWSVYNYLCLHRLEWIAAADREFEDGDNPVITAISIEKVEEED